MLNSSVYICARVWVSARLSVWRLLDVGGPPQHNTTPTPPEGARMLEPSATVISLKLTLPLRRTTAQQIMKKCREEETSRCLLSLSHGFWNVPPVWSGTALLFPLQPFIKRNGLLNRVLCRADLFMFLFPRLLPKGSY